MTRRNDRRLALLAGGGLALLFTMIAAVQVAAWSVGKVENSSHRELSGSVDELFIESQNGDVTVIRSIDGKVRIDGRSKGTLHAPAPEIDVQRLARARRRQLPGLGLRRVPRRDRRPGAGAHERAREVGVGRHRGPGPR